MDQKTRSNPAMPFVVNADPLLRPLIPGYLASRRQDLVRLAEAFEKGDLAALRKLGHNMSGSGAAYGIPPISAFGKRIEDAALAGDTAGVAAAIEELRAFLDTVKLPP